MITSKPFRVHFIFRYVYLFDRNIVRIIYLDNDLVSNNSISYLTLLRAQLMSEEKKKLVSHLKEEHGRYLFVFEAV